MSLAPITLFTYNRPWHTKQTIEALQKNNLAHKSDLYIFSDGPKNESANEKVQQVRNYIKTIAGFKNLTIIERKKNIGLGKSIIIGVTEIINKYEKVIVLEDDVVASPFFLNYMNQALNIYKNNEKIGSINSFFYPIGDNLPESFLLRKPDSCGWGTWKNRWSLLNPDAQELYKKIKKTKLINKFNIDGTYPFYQMLKGQIKGLNDSWAIRWYASLFLLNKLNLYYGKPLVKNIGWDGTGTHSGSINIFKNYYYHDKIDKLTIITPTEENTFVLNKLKKYFKTPKMFTILKLIKIRNTFRIFLIDLGLKKKK
jgi:hypothetical protein